MFSTSLILSTASLFGTRIVIRTAVLEVKRHAPDMLRTNILWVCDRPKKNTVDSELSYRSIKFSVKSQPIDKLRISPNLYISFYVNNILRFGDNTNIRKQWFRGSFIGPNKAIFFFSTQRIHSWSLTIAFHKNKEKFYQWWIEYLDPRRILSTLWLYWQISSQL